MDYKAWFAKIVMIHNIAKETYLWMYDKLKIRFWNIPSKNDVYWSILQEMLLWSPNNPMIYMSLWDIAYKEKRYQQALQQYQLYNDYMKKKFMKDKIEYENIIGEKYWVEFEPTPYYVSQIQEIQKKLVS